MSMKLSRRDKVIILVVLVFAVIGGGILALLKPKWEEVQASNDRLAAKEGERAEVEAKIATLDDLKAQLKRNVESIVEDQKEFISEKEIFEPQQISTYLMDMLEPSGIDITDIEVPALNKGMLAAYTYNKNALAYEMKINSDLARELPEEVYYAYNGDYPSPPPEVYVGLSTVTVKFQFEDPTQIFEAIQSVADNEKDIYLITVSSEQAQDGTFGEQVFFEGTMVIEVYTINPLDPADIDKNISMPVQEEVEEEW